MNLSITPATLAGHIDIPASKSIMHRALICASLSAGTSLLQRVYCSQDILATIDNLRALGATIKVDGDCITVTGIDTPATQATLDCGESGSTIRFMIPIAAALGVSTTFLGHGKLVTRPLALYQDTLPAHGVCFDYQGALPCHVAGQLTGGNYAIKGDVSSQFITGLLFALPLLQQDSVLQVLPPFESKSYVNITIDCLKSFGIAITEQDDCYYIKGGQHYQATNYVVESDYSQSAFLLTAGAMGCDLTIGRFDRPSAQGDAAILFVLKASGLLVSKVDGNYSVKQKDLTPFEITAEDIPDLVPILCVLATQLQGVSTIRRVERLKIKESDRIQSTLAMINGLGGQASYADDCITIHPTPLVGGQVDCQNDHRIAMAGGIASIVCSAPVVLKGAECVNKSYPTFWEEFQRLGGVFDVLDMD